MPRQVSPPASRPVAWALLSQALWLPLLAVDLQDRWTARVEKLTPRPGGGNSTLPLLSPPPASGASLSSVRPPSASGFTSSGLLLGSSPLGRGAGAVADAFAVEQHRCFVFFAFTDDNDAIHIYGVEQVTHRVNRRTIGCIFIATTNPLRGSQSGRLSNTD